MYWQKDLALQCAAGVGYINGITDYKTVAKFEASQNKAVEVDPILGYGMVHIRK